VLYLEVTDRAGGIVKNGRSDAVFHDPQIGLPSGKSNRDEKADLLRLSQERCIVGSK
jgi:hypothetical protein